MPTIKTFAADSPAQAINAAIAEDGACIVSGLLPTAAADQVVAEVMPYVEQTRFGGDEFSGRRTRRTGALVARSPACRDIVMNPLVISLAQQFLEPYTQKILLHLTQTIFIGPGESAQMFHRDRQAWGSYLPAEVEPQFNTIWALTDFTRSGVKAMPLALES